MDFTTGPTPPSESKILRSLEDELVSTEVPARARRVLIKGELSGDLPFPGGFGYVRWEGSTEIALCRIPSSDVEPVPVVVPRSVCP
jgi:hypothetical protein